MEKNGNKNSNYVDYIYTLKMQWWKGVSCGWLGPMVTCGEREINIWFLPVINNIEEVVVL